MKPNTHQMLADLEKTASRGARRSETTPPPAPKVMPAQARIAKANQRIADRLASGTPKPR